MDDARTAGLTLLERATNYCLGSLSLVPHTDLSSPTPCTAWNLRALLRHMNDSLAALCEAVDVGQVDTDALEHGDDADGVLVSLQDNVCRLLGAWTNWRGVDTITIAGSPLPVGVLAGTGALEIAIHGWDVARACGHDQPLPEALAEELLDLAPLIVTDADRPARFAPPVEVHGGAASSDRLVAFLGRTP